MQVSLEERFAIEDILSKEAESLDNRDWDSWLALFTEDVEFWVPSWDSEDELTKDPNAEISLMYYKGRSGLEDRVFRIRTGHSAASTPMPRTCHITANPRIEKAEYGFQVTARWMASAFRQETSMTYYGSYHYRLVGNTQALKIAAKKIVLCNDLISTPLDIYNI
ncbi:aromatic-ring-hydroxylating dioxygenase subunit beta [Acidocella sp.]|uniref:aromatic-ring-hydroxylating dioxygenase subunit beta n=1 Tax=Acidocella sp. TaxID=50710 RepID=UPI002607F1CB|nr:aromatic-ring-hydroxylating dioxygenase subunit beta [Acidocella sp.]MDD2795406.1 aromatic-ring-hydroxylating dioxygenase subunit beta [Acidocella sp.]